MKNKMAMQISCNVKYYIELINRIFAPPSASPLKFKSATCLATSRQSNAPIWVNLQVAVQIFTRLYNHLNLFFSWGDWGPYNVIRATRLFLPAVIIFCPVALSGWLH